jgi:hypothetical protein
MTKLLASNTAIIILFILLISCNKPNKKFDTWVFDDTKTETLIFIIKNLDDVPYFIADNAWLYKKGDTLLVEAVYKSTTDSSMRIYFNQFNPPSMEIINPDSFLVKKIPYKDLTIKIDKVISIRVFTKENPYNPESDYIKYHSITEFNNYEKTNSFLLNITSLNVDKIKNW